MRLKLFAALGAALGALAGPAAAQDYPSRPITIIVPFAAGGPTDVIARLVADHMSRTLNQRVLVENVPGAGGTTGSDRGAKARPDGYTILMGHMGTHGASPALYPRLPYDPARDFAPIGLVAGTPIVIVTRPTLEARTLADFVTMVRARGTDMTQGHAGVGSVSHVTGLLLNSTIGAQTTTVGYRGTGPAMNDLMGGQFDYMTDQIVNVTSQVRGGTIRALAIATPQRSPALPDVPTTAEAGLPNFQASAWNALFAPKDTPPAIVQRLNAALVAALDDDNTRARLLDLGAVIPDRAGRSPEALGELVRSEIARLTPVIRAAGATAE
jgi:tripartite-type tricarboxylate transporter receptor subunit TctC